MVGMNWNGNLEDVHLTRSLTSLDKIGRASLESEYAREHVAEIEWELRQVKQRMRYTCSKFLFQFIPNMVLIYIMYNVCL